jgi:hypothetical protein
VAHCFYFLHITCFLFSGRVADHWRWGGIATSEAYIWDSAPCATYLCLCLRVKFSVRGWDEARDGAYGPPSMSGRQIFVCGACVLARRRVLLRLNRTQNIAKKKKTLRHYAVTRGIMMNMKQRQAAYSGRAAESQERASLVR